MRQPEVRRSGEPGSPVARLETGKYVHTSTDFINGAVDSDRDPGFFLGVLIVSTQFVGGRLRCQIRRASLRYAAKKLGVLAPQCFPSEDPRQRSFRIICNGVDDLSLHRPDEIRLGGKVAARVPTATPAARAIWSMPISRA